MMPPWEWVSWGKNSIKVEEAGSEPAEVVDVADEMRMDAQRAGWA
jgi:hypothetical protein